MCPSWSADSSLGTADIQGIVLVVIENQVLFLWKSVTFIFVPNIQVFGIDVDVPKSFIFDYVFKLN